MASQYPLSDSLQADRERALIELAARLQRRESEAPLPGPSQHMSGEVAMPQPSRYAVWVYPRARGRSAMAPAALRQNSSAS